MDLVHDLYLTAALPSDWEIEFAKNIPSWTRRAPTLAQAAKLLEISQERRKRTDGLTMSVSEGLQALKDCDLEDWEKAALAELVDGWMGYLQLRDYNHLSGMLRSHGIDFPPVVELNFRLGRHELADIARQLRVRKQDERKARRAARIPQPRHQTSGSKKGCGNDMAQVHAAILMLQKAMGSADLKPT
ncbi:hypothetical protein [Brevundimonas sp. DWR2-3-1b1]|uniref:hypothetical protein n=1 Tax=unclassified Brevundimonas TaxID=2622653 RepID=UPI003CF18A16